MRMTSLVLFVGILGSQVKAEIIIAGVGAQPCGTFLNARTRPGDGYAKDSFSLGVFSWIQGFISGVNVTVREAEKKYYDLDTIGRDEQWAYVVEFCRRNPNKDISRAAESLMLHRLRLVPAPTPRSGGR